MCIFYSYSQKDAIDDGILIPILVDGKDYIITNNLYHELKPESPKEDPILKELVDLGLEALEKASDEDYPDDKLRTIEFQSLDIFVSWKEHEGFVFMLTSDY